MSIIMTLNVTQLPSLFHYFIFWKQYIGYFIASVFFQGAKSFYSFIEVLQSLISIAIFTTTLIFRSVFISDWF